MVYFLKLNMGLYLRIKFQVSSIIQTSFRQVCMCVCVCNFTPNPPPPPPPPPPPKKNP